MARSWVRPLALHTGSVRFTDPEIEALNELAATKDEKLRLRFLEQAVRSPVTTRQLRNRAKAALNAALGLDLRRREAAEQVLLRGGTRRG